MKRLTTAILIVASGALLPGGAAAQTDTCPGFREIVDAAVPPAVGDRELMSRLLAAKVGPQLGQSFDPAVAEKALGDNLRPGPGCRDRTRTCLYRGQRGSVLQAKLPAGLLTYLNPKRRFDGAKGVNNDVSEEVARRAALDGFAAFGVPAAEIGPPFVRALMAATQDTPLKTPTQVLRAEVHVNVPRHVEGTPVFASRTMAAIDGAGRIARLYVQWPDFSILPGLRPEATLPRPAVVEQVLEKMAADNPCGSVSKVLARIAYVPSSLLERSDESNEVPGDEKVRGFVPALAVFVVPPEVRPGETVLGEQEFVVPLLGAPPQ
jgi:hypothetical protein